MALNTEAKKKIIDDNKQSDNDTSSPEVQIALLTEKIHKFNAHFKKNIHDFGSKRGLLVNIGRRRRLLKYLSRKDSSRYEAILKKLGLRK